MMLHIWQASQLFYYIALLWWNYVPLQKVNSIYHHLILKIVNAFPLYFRQLLLINFLRYELSSIEIDGIFTFG